MTTSRIQFDMDNDFVEELAKRMKLCGITTRKQYFEYALALMNWCEKESMKGKVITAIDVKNNSYREISLPLLDKLRQDYLLSQSNKTSCPECGRSKT